MNTSGKSIVSGFYTSDFFNETENVNKYLHPDMELFWNARTGYLHMSREDVLTMASEASKSFDTVRCEITHLLEDGNNVTIRYTYFVKTIENPNEEVPVAHFMAIWTIKDDLMYRGYQMSQPAEEDPEAMISYQGINL
ncbi:nuclear transport factor 2 family protein [uncultured Dokdonia sp.]|uniref:nuclear transport factor 2 family protein n=1 Tax=uncultured Dokdonia sp. TaxID=575653 RepID=UPI0026187C27|nr:nuclear transport factor 2 family protein [uncultured Dokdonia sp.]